MLETSHYRNNGGHDDFYREHIDMPVLKSICYDYESMLLNDGCTGIAVSIHNGSKKCNSMNTR